MNEWHHYAVYDEQTGAIISAGKSTNPAIIAAARRALAPGQALYEGEIDVRSTMFVEGQPVSKPTPIVVVTARQIKEYAGRILSYTDWVDIRSINGAPADPALLAYRQAVRDASNALEAMNPIPTDYRDAKYWPPAP